MDITEQIIIVNNTNNGYGNNNNYNNNSYNYEHDYSMVTPAMVVARDNNYSKG